MYLSVNVKVNVNAQYIVFALYAMGQNQYSFNLIADKTKTFQNTHFGSDAAICDVTSSCIVVKSTKSVFF